jgi:hypothetical protein
MKSHTLIVASLCLVVGLAGVPAYSQNSVRAKVPFNFVVSGKTFAAGDYTMTLNPHQVKIENDRGLIVATVLTNEISGHTVGQTGELIFHCYKDHCFLSQVWSAARENGRQFFAPRAETELAKAEQGKYFAILGEKPQKLEKLRKSEQLKETEEPRN